MELIPYEQAINKLKLGKKNPLNSNICFDTRFDYDWARGKHFVNLFLPYLKLKIDSREQDDWVAKICEFYGIAWEKAKKNKKAKTENLKEGDITFSVNFENKIYDYTGIVAYERKGSASEFCNNVMNDRDRLEKEFDRQMKKGYKKFVLVLEIGNCLYDLIDYKFSYSHKQIIEEKTCGNTVFATVASWVQPNKYAFDVIQCDTQSTSKKERSIARNKLFWLMLLDMYYFFRQEIRLEAQELVDSQKAGA